jgi:hypothetical protein
MLLDMGLLAQIPSLIYFITATLIAVVAGVLSAQDILDDSGAAECAALWLQQS